MVPRVLIKPLCAQIRRANLETQVLLAAASENSEMFTTLRAQLGLSEEQCRQLQSLTGDAREEARRLDAIAKCFSVLRAHDWLYFPGMEVRLPSVGSSLVSCADCC